MEKRILKIIAKRWCKGVLESSEALVSFADSGLTTEQINYIQIEIENIAERITKEKANPSTDALVEEYFE